MSTTITALQGKRDIDGRELVKGLAKAAPEKFKEKFGELERRGGTYLVRLRSEAERARLATERQFAGFFARHICEGLDKDGKPKCDKDGKPLLKSVVSVPFQSRVDRTAARPHTVVDLCIEVGTEPTPVDLRRAMFLIGHRRWGLLVEEVVIKPGVAKPEPATEEAEEAKTKKGPKPPTG